MIFFFQNAALLTILFFIDHKFDLSAGSASCVRYGPHPQSVFGRGQASDGVIHLILTNVQGLSGICYEKKKIKRTITPGNFVVYQAILELHTRPSRNNWMNEHIISEY